MSNYLEKFEKMRIAGSLASKTLDMITDYVKVKKIGVKFLAYRCKLNDKEIKIEKKIDIIDE